METITVRRDSISDATRNFILKRDRFRCRYCGSNIPPFHLDHVYPVSKGGVTNKDNLVTACRNCNKSKYNRIGIYPKPVGYFEKENYRKFYVFMSHVVLGTLITFLFLSSQNEPNSSIRSLEITVGSVCWLPILLSIFDLSTERIKNGLKEIIHEAKRLGR